MDCSSDAPLGRQIYILSQDMRNFAEKYVLKPYGITVEQLHLLKCLYQYTGLSQKEIGEIGYKTPANTTRLLDRLQAKDLVVRRENPEDRRAMLVFLTERGQELVQEVENVFESFKQSFLNGLSEEELAVIQAGLRKITENLLAMTRKISQQAS